MKNKTTKPMITPESVLELGEPFMIIQYYTTPLSMLADSKPDSRYELITLLNIEMNAPISKPIYISERAVKRLSKLEHTEVTDENGTVYDFMNFRNEYKRRQRNRKELVEILKSI